jgi:hypothetical protein
VEVDRFALKGALSFNFLNIVGYCFLLMVETRNEFLSASVRTTSSLFHDADSLGSCQSAEEGDYKHLI